MKKNKFSALLIIGSLTLLAGCGGIKLTRPEISSEPVTLSPIKTNEGFGFISSDGQVAVKPQFIDAKPFSDGLAAVQVSTKDRGNVWGFINHKGEFVIEPKFTSVEPFAEQLALVSIIGKLKPFFIDRNGATVVEPKESWTFASSFSSGLAPVNIQGKFGFVNKKGELIIETKFDGVRPFADGLAYVQVGQGSQALVGYVDTSGKLAIPLDYSGGTDFSQGSALVQKGLSILSSFSLIDKTGKQLQSNLSPTCSEGENLRQGFSEGLFPIKLEIPNQSNSFFKSYGCGFINVRGETVVPPNQKVEEVGQFSEGLAAVKMKMEDYQQKWGYIDKTGKVVIEPIFEEASSFKNGLAYVKVNAAKEGYINPSGQFVWQPVTF